MEAMRVLVSALLVFGAASGLRWSDRLLEEDVQVCSGQNILLFWNFTLDQGERLKGMVWSCEPEGREEGMLATYVDDHFVPTSSFSGRLAHLKDGGIELSCATILESGNYSIAVTVEKGDNSLFVYRKTRSVSVVDTPKTQNGEIHVTRKEEAVRDVTTGAWHVQLSCGNFSDRGHPPIDVIWTTPGGVQTYSSSFQDGFFDLLLPNPLEGGNYSCQVPPSQAASRCLPADSPLLDKVSMDVGEVSARFALLEARQQEVLDRMAADDLRWAGVANRTGSLERRLDELFDVSHRAPVSFYARLTRDINYGGGMTLILDKVIHKQGEGYDPVTGHFTAPVNGTYFFMAAANSPLHVLKEGTEIAQVHEVGDDVGFCHVIVHLNAKQRVWVTSGDDWGLVYMSQFTAFSGFRIS